MFVIVYCSGQPPTECYGCSGPFHTEKQCVEYLNRLGLEFIDSFVFGECYRLPNSNDAQSCDPVAFIRRISPATSEIPSPLPWQGNPSAN